MVDGAAADAWSAVAGGWSRWWGTFAAPAWEAMLDAAAVRAGTRVLDVGCGSGELLAHLAGLGAVPAGAEPAAGMRELARARLPGADVRDGSAESLPWPDGTFDVVTAVNALQFAEDPVEGLAELARVARPGGLVAVANWADAAHNDLDTVEDAVARAAGEEPADGGPLRLPGGLRALFDEAGLTPVAAGLTGVPWSAPDDATLVAAVLLGEDEETIAGRGPAVVAAAAPFRGPDGGYRLDNAFRWAVGRVPDVPAGG